MTMENIDAWIIQENLKDSVGLGSISGWRSLQELHVTSHGVGWVGDGAIPCSETFGENLEFVAVQMHWVTDGNESVVYDDSKGVGLTKIVDVPVCV